VAAAGLVLGRRAHEIECDGRELRNLAKIT
jgi:hypothetical protein